PLRRNELVDLLCAELTAEDAGLFRELVRLLSALCQFEHYRLLERLKVAYATFDPDTDTHSTARLSAEERDRRFVELLGAFAWVMERATFTGLGPSEIEPALHGASDWGLYTDVDFHVFERLVIYARGDTIDRRQRRRLRGLYRTEDVDVPVWQRLVM